jgi:hypothetical protein
MMAKVDQQPQPIEVEEKKEALARESREFTRMDL